MLKAKQIDFSGGQVRQNIVAAASPMLTAQILNLLYNIIDRIYIGKIPGEGTVAFAGLGLCFPIITIIAAFSNPFGIGGAPLCSIAMGRKDTAEAKKIMINAYFMLLGTGILLTILGITFQRPLLYLFGASGETYPYAAGYMTIYLLGTVFVMTSLGLNPYINSQGFAKIGMLTVLLGAVSNIALDPVFIFVFRLGVKGAAIATVLSQFLSAAWVLRFLTKKAELKLDFRGFRADFACIRKISFLGTASFMMSFTDSLVQVACNAMLQSFGGDIYIGVMTVINSIRQIAQTPVGALTDGAAPVISYNYGAKKYDKVREAVKFMTRSGFFYTMIVWGLLFLSPQFFIHIFTQETDLVKAAIPSMHIYFFGFVMMAFQFAGQATFKSLNRAGYAVFFSILRKAIIVAPLTFLLPHIAGLGVKGVFLAEPISNLVGGLACYITMRLTVMKELNDPLPKR